VGLLYSSNMDLVLVAVEVQGNTYLNMTLDQAGQEHRNQTNLAILAFQRQYGVRRYVRLLGDERANDTFVGFAEHESNLYVLGRREELPGNIWLRTFNIYLAILRLDTGFITQEVRLGSRALQDEPLDLQVNYQGVWLLAKIGSYFCQEGRCGLEQWDNGILT
jgi:hypothetical protein